MSLEVTQFENELMKSNCYIITDRNTSSCVVIDPGSEKSKREIDYIESNQLHLDYIILTHEHTDHTWGVNALKAKFPYTKLVCSELCNKYAKKASRAYFLFYYDDPTYRYELAPADIVIKDGDDLRWNDDCFMFIHTPGHSRGSMCIYLDNMLFTGDTIMPYKPYFNGRDSNEEEWKKSIERISVEYDDEIVIYPGHGDFFFLKNWKYGF